MTATELPYFTVVSAGLHSIGVDYVDLDRDPDEKTIYAFVDFTVREKPGTVHWASGLTPPRGIVLDPIRGRYSPEDGKLRVISGSPKNEKQQVLPTGNPYTLGYKGNSTGNLAQFGDPGLVQVALEALPGLAGNVYVYRVAVNEKQLITIHTATGGVFPLTFNGQTTVSPISRNANAGSIQQALQALSTIGNEGCSVTGPVGGPWTFEATGLLASQNIPMLTSSSAGLTPSGTITITEVVPGSSTSPYNVSFINELAGTDVPTLTGTNATITTGTQGDPQEGVELVADTPLLELGLDKDGNQIPLIYDVTFTEPPQVSGAKGHVLGGFGFEAPAGGAVVDLSSVTKLPPKSVGWS